ncbi:hypothetical protein ATY38_11035 [Nitrosomonas ureae]|nr:hypothetical protein ATY38_11035 [Nitrosomonas ureae]
MQQVSLGKFSLSLQQNSCGCAEVLQSEIATVIDRSVSTISRELVRNCGARGYRPKQAHNKAIERKAINARAIDDVTWQFAQEKLMLQWSPDQISNYAGISIETVYQRVYADKRNGGILWKNLRCQKQRRKRYGKTDRRGIIPNRQSIEQRPAIVDARSRIGGWEADTIIGKNHRQAIVSLVERKTGYTLIRKVERKTTEAVIKATTRLLKPHRRRVHTITSDNGLPAESTDIYLKNIPGTCTVPNNKSRPSAACT